MWRTLKNWFYSFWTYRDLGPDIVTRWEVNQRLRSQRRPSPLNQWAVIISQLSRQQGYQVPPSTRLLQFTYTHLQKYSGIDFRYVRLHDRLQEDLRFALVCWFDWETQFCDDVYNELGIDISLTFDADDCETVGDLIKFLIQSNQPLASAC